MEKENYSCTVLGANGFLGRHLVHYLHKEGFSVFAYDIQEVRNPNISQKVPYEQFDICGDLENIRLDVDFLFVFSGITGTKNGFDKYRTFINVNEIGLLNILSKLKEMESKPKIIFPSTRLVYKGQECPLSEDAEKEAKTIYAANKLACEYYLKMYANCFGIQYTIYRICVPYGNIFDGEFSYGTVGAFLNKAEKGETISLFGDGSIKRTLTHIMSICQQITDSMVLPASNNQTYNIAGETLSLKELAIKIADIYGTNVSCISWNEIDEKIESGSTVFDGGLLENLIKIDHQWNIDKWVEQIKKRK